MKSFLKKRHGIVYQNKTTTKMTVHFEFDHNKENGGKVIILKITHNHLLFFLTT